MRVPPAPLVAWCEDGRLLIDGEPVSELPRGRGWSQRRVYLVGPVRWDVVAGLLGPRDTLSGPRAGAPQGATVACDHRGSWELMGGDAWGLPGDAAAAVERLAELREAVADMGWRWASTAAGLGTRLAWEVFRARGDEVGQLEPRYRGLAHRALHPGPQLAVRTGELGDAVAFDRVAAYLQGMRAPVPTPGTWRAVRWGTPWGRLREREGIVTARVQVESWTGALPPLPVQGPQGRVAWPEGEMVGTWPIGWLRWAEEAHGVTVADIVDGALCEVSPHLEEIADLFDGVPHPRLRKLLYQRTWGRMASDGWWSASIGPEGTGAKLGGHRWGWTWAGRDRFGHQNPPHYRPDWAAWVCNHNTIEVLRACHRIPWGALHAAHVDCLWVPAGWEEELRWALCEGGDWAVKARGPLTLWGVGCYEHGGKIRAMGLEARPGETLTRAQVQAHAERTRLATGGQLTADGMPWPAESLGRWQAATVVAPAWDRSLWTPGGWRTKEPLCGWTAGEEWVSREELIARGLLPEYMDDTWETT